MGRTNAGTTARSSRQPRQPLPGMDRPVGGAAGRASLPADAAAHWDIGRAARKAVPRSQLGAWQAPEGRPDPVDVLTAQEVDRVPELVPLRHERMAASAFTFYRGAAALMAQDLGTRPSTGLIAQLAGDAHLANFGGFATADRTLIFDLNDFDETLPGPFEWDVSRLVASFEVAGRHRGFTAEQRRGRRRGGRDQYRNAMAEFAGMSRLDVWYARIQAEDIVERWVGSAYPDRIEVVPADPGQGPQEDQRRRRCPATPPVGQTVSCTSSAIPRSSSRSASSWGWIRPMSARRWRRSWPSTASRSRTTSRSCSTATGSSTPPARWWASARSAPGAGSPCWWARTTPPTTSCCRSRRPTPPCWSPSRRPASYENHGRRVVEGQRLMQASSDMLLGWTRVPGIDGVWRDFYVRQMWDWKTSPDLEAMDHLAMGVYARMCGWTLARAHARSGNRYSIAAYLGSGRTLHPGHAAVRRLVRRPEPEGLRGVPTRHRRGPDPEGGGH